MRRRQKERSKLTPSWRTLGVIGAGRGVGVTHMVVWGANYLTGVKGETTAVLEWNDHRDFERMRQFCRGKILAEAAGRARIGNRTEGRQSASLFRILNVNYCGQADAVTLADCLLQDYCRILVDFGEMTEKNLAECARCDRKLVIGSLTEWKAGVFLELAGRSLEWDESWSLAAVFGSGEMRKEWEKLFEKPCLQIPFSEDAYLIRWEDMEFFHALFN